LFFALRRLADCNAGPQREVLGFLAHGLTTEQMAGELFLSPLTIRTHVRNAMEKLGAQTRTHAVALALREGEIERDISRRCS
jgi:DNA-binding CsgD family transcriptional regulator